MFTWLEDFIFEFSDHGGDELRIGVGKEGDSSDQGPTVEVYHILRKKTMIKFVKTSRTYQFHRPKFLDFICPVEAPAHKLSFKV